MPNSKHNCSWAGSTLMIEKVYPLLSKSCREDAAAIQRLFEMFYNAFDGSIDAYLLSEGRERATAEASSN